jgi:hypothetical protein
MKCADKVQILINDRWIYVDTSKVKKGMTFKMFEDDWTPVQDGKEWVAQSDSYLENRNWHIDIE